MSCSSTREWLLQAALPEELADAPARVGTHLRQCVDCQRLVRSLHRLEHGLRDRPIPANASAVRDGFLLRHDGIVARPLISESPVRYRAALWFGLVALAAAIMLLVTLAGGTVAWLISSKQAATELAKQTRPSVQPNEVKAAIEEPAQTKGEQEQSTGHNSESPPALGNDVIARLIETNLQLSDEANAEARGQIYSDRVAALKADVARLPEQDRTLAETLVEDGQWLATNTEPLDQADRFTALADRIVDRIDSASGDADVAARMVKYYQHVSARGIAAKLDRVGKAGTSDEARQHQLEKIQNREAKRLQKLERVHAIAPAAVKKEIRKLLEQSNPKPKSKKKQNDGVVG